jgi:hypothetical protein
VAECMSGAPAGKHLPSHDILRTLSALASSAAAATNFQRPGSATTRVRMGTLLLRKVRFNKDRTGVRVAASKGGG